MEQQLYKLRTRTFLANTETLRNRITDALARHQRVCVLTAPPPLMSLNNIQPPRPTPSTPGCVLHPRGRHSTLDCIQFANQPEVARRHIITSQHLCWKCLGNHLHRACTATPTCATCQQTWHCTAAHFSHPISNQPERSARLEASTRDSSHSIKRIPGDRGHDGVGSAGIGNRDHVHTYPLEADILASDKYFTCLPAPPKLKDVRRRFKKLFNTSNKTKDASKFCVLHNSKHHDTSFCKAYLKLDPNEKFFLRRKNNLCDRCLTNHFSQPCPRQ